MSRVKQLTLILFIALQASGCISPELRTARIAMNEKDWNRALNALEAELARASGNAEALWRVGLCYQNLGDWEKMSLYYDSSLAVSPQFEGKIKESRRRLVAKHFRRSLTAYDSARWDEALADLDTAIIIDPHDKRLLQQATVTAYYGERYPDAINYAMRAIEMEEGGVPELSVREVLLTISRDQEKHQETVKWARELMSAVDPAVDTTDIYLRAFDALIAAYEALGQHGEAQSAIKDAISIFPERMELRMNLAALMYRQGNTAAARELYREVLAFDPGNFNANLNLGTLLVTDKQYLEAIPFLEKAHQLDPESQITIQNLMAAYFNSGQDAQGLEMKKKLEALTGGE